MIEGPPVAPSETAAAPFGLSIVIPAFDAGATLRATLDSLVAQTDSDWEAVVVDDGSVDDTFAVASEYAGREPRIRVIRQPNAGPSVARNLGRRHGRHPWILFLDADDWIDRSLVERVRAALAADPGLDAVHAGWAFIGVDGRILERDRCHETGDLFPLLCRRCPFPIHACVVRRSLVERVGGFDPTQRMFEDWTLWQRIARVGARFGAVAETLAFYRIGGASLSSHPDALFEAALEAIDLGQSNDPRLPPDTRVGRTDPAALDAARLEYLYWAAAVMIASRRDPSPLAARLPTGPVAVDANGVATALFRDIPLALGRPRSDWLELWPGVIPSLQAFLDALAVGSGAAGVDRAVLIRLERRILTQDDAREPASLRYTRRVIVEVSEPISDHEPPPNVERLLAGITLAGRVVGEIELPVCGGWVRAAVLADAIADRFGWLILGRFFEGGAYAAVEFRSDEDGWSAWSSDHRLADRLPADPVERRVAFHDQAGWPMFLDQLWGPLVEDDPPGQASADPSPRWRFIEVSEPVQPQPAGRPSGWTEVRVGGCPVAAVALSSEGSYLTAQSVRALITETVGYELCRAAVREGVIGQPFDDGSSLRQRLRVSVERTVDSVTATIQAGHATLAPGWAAAIAGAATRAGAGLVIGRRAYLPAGTSVARYAVLPSGTAELLADVEQRRGTPLARIEGADPMIVGYAPDALWVGADDEASLANRPQPSAVDSGGEPPAESIRFEFETAFARSADPWRYDSEYERVKYQQTLELLPAGRIERALELACAEGHFTSQLAARVGSLVAADISEIALARAAERCREHRNIEYRRLDLTGDSLPRGFDLVVCSEVLYFVGNVDAVAAIGAKLAGALVQGGYLLTAHANTTADDPDHTGFDWAVPFGAKTIAQVLGAVPGLQLVRELRTPLYRILLFRSGLDQTLQPELIETERFALPIPEVAARIQWHGAGARRTAPTVAPIETRQLPILLYHRVARSGVPSRDRYRVTPEAFEEQVRFLRECGFRGVSLDEWGAAALARRPLPGRAVLITFDDGFADFEEHAWPVLARYRFGATVFLTTGSVGRWNDWDPNGNLEPLLGWDAIARLHRDGVAFGAHGVHHRRATSLSPTEVVREAVGSRAAIEERLGTPVTAFAYPHGDDDESIHHLVGASGFAYGLTCVPRLATWRTPLLGLPRIEVTGDSDLPAFIARLAGSA